MPDTDARAHPPALPHVRRCTYPQPACTHCRYGAVIDCVYAREAPAVVNDPASAELVASAARKVCVSDGAVSIDRSIAHAAAAAAFGCQQREPTGVPWGR